MTRLLRIGLCSLLLGLLVVPLRGQVIGQQTVSAQSSGGGCTAVAQSCAIFQVPVTSSIALQIAGTFSGTLTFEATADGVNWISVSLLAASDGATLATTTASAGIFSISNTGYLQLRARATAWSSGTALVTANRGEGILKTGGGGGGGNGITTLTGDVVAGPGSGSQASTISNSAVTNAKIANSTIDLTTKVTNALPCVNGGTGQSAFTDGQVLIGNTSSGCLSKTTFTAGANVTITPGSGSLTFAATGNAVTTNPLSQFAATTSAQLRGVLSDETGGGAAVFQDSPLFTTAVTSQGPINYCQDAGSTDSYACNLSPAITAYAKGAFYAFNANTANTGAASINFNGLGAKTIVKVQGGITTALNDNDIRAGQQVVVMYDNTNMEIVSQLGNAPAASAAGSGTELQFRNAGSLGAVTSSTYDGTTVSVPKLAASTVFENAIGGSEPASPSEGWQFVRNDTHLFEVYLNGAWTVQPLVSAPGGDCVFTFLSSVYGCTTSIGVPQGGSGRATGATAYGLIAAGTTATGAQQTISPGASGNILVSNGSSALGSFQPFSIPVYLQWNVGVGQASTGSIACSLPASNPAAAAVAASSTPTTGVAQFTSSGTAVMECQFQFPHDWTASSALDIALVWRSISTSGNVRWIVKTGVVPTGSTLGGMSYSAAVNVDSTAAATTLQTTRATSTNFFSGSSPAADALGYVSITRVGGGTGDTMTTNPAELIGIVVTLRETKVVGG